MYDCRFNHHILDSRAGTARYMIDEAEVAAFMHALLMHGISLMIALKDTEVLDWYPGEIVFERKLRWRTKSWIFSRIEKWLGEIYVPEI